MNKKSLVGIIVFLLFVIVLTLIDRHGIRDEAHLKLQKERKSYEEEITALKGQIVLEEEVEQENIKLKRDISYYINENKRLTDIYREVSIFPAIVTDAEIDGELLKLHTIYVTHENDELIQVEDEFINIITKDVPIYMRNELNNLSEEDWDYMVNVDRTPYLEIFQDKQGKAVFIREVDRQKNYIFKG